MCQCPHLVENEINVRGQRGADNNNNNNNNNKLKLGCHPVAVVILNAYKI